MKKIITVFAILLASVSLMNCSEDFIKGAKIKQMSFSAYELFPISPANLMYKEQVGKNWWKGSYEGMPVLIHAVEVRSYVNVDITFIPQEKGE